ncbi:hypothetical protein EYB45_09480 [Erythrobacteraceae bacterium CFH 75059]|uniref:hypothetical protein n=1 Tax=Qipengyuania thermophila TaxID=2509361 RepID=UPI00102118AB|nr:hypothetical protein [Qipengyuania thermophila]TCD02209.1 hypothetical protein EYB45_09480 [Erythrobacteraceae bacterium CFH 75059]
MSWLKKAADQLTGKAARERASAQRANIETARRIISEHEARAQFSADAVLSELRANVPKELGETEWDAHCFAKITAVTDAVLDDGLLSPDEEAKLSAAMDRYGNPPLDPVTQGKLDAARLQFAAWNTPLDPVEAPLLLKRGEWCVHGIQATAYEERQRTTRIAYAGPTARIKIMKGVYYRAGSAQVARKTEAYHHSFGSGFLCATNKRLLWVAPNKTVTIPLNKIIMFEPFSDGIKVFKDTGKPVLFEFDEGENQPAMVRISRTIEELR